MGHRGVPGDPAVKPLDIGARYKGLVVPGATDLASAIGNAGVDVVSSPATIGYLEMACLQVMEPCFEPGEASVGVGFGLEHKAAALPYRSMEVEAELLSHDGRRFTFRAEALQDGREIMSGEHVRALIDLDRFLKSVPAARRRPRPPLTFWFDVHSPWCYLASLRIGGIARRFGLKLNWRPLQLPRLIEAIDGRRALEENPGFVAWYKQDLQDHAALQGLTIRYHPQFPLRNSRALRICLLAADEGLAEPFVTRTMRAYWSESADISDLDVLAGLAAESGLDAERARRAAVDESYRRRLEANTAEAAERGVFGVPTVDTGAKLYFGNDRLDLLVRHLTTPK